MNIITPLIITVSDGLLTDSQVINIRITDDFPPVLLDNIPDMTFEEDTVLSNAINLGDHFFDRDMDALFYSSGQSQIIVEIGTDGRVTFRAKANWYGEEQIKFKAEDPENAIAEDIITVTVLPVNDAPMILPIPQQEGYVGDVWILDLKDYVMDVDDEHTSLRLDVTG